MPKKKEAFASPFVPEEEQPYPIPENWCWVKLGNLYEINPKITADDTILASFVPMERIEAGMTGRFTFEIQPWGKARKNHTQFADGDVAFAKISPCFENQKSMMVQGLMNGIGGGTTELIILRQAQMNQKYTFLLVSTEDFISRGKATYSGTVGQQRISMDFVKAYPVPVPPLPEQYRIVTRIESLFAKLDMAREKAQAVVDGFELRKSAILHKAFTGELTERWRKDHGVGLDSWKIMLLNDCIQKMQNGLAKRSGSIGESYVVLRLANLSEDGFDTSDLREILLDEKEQEAYSLLGNDVIMIRVNGSKDNVGRQLLVPDVKKWAFCDHIIRIRYRNNVLPDYMVLFSKSDNYRTYVKDHMVSSAGQNTISRKGIANMAVPVPECDEQKEIVRTLSVLFNKEQQAKEAAEAVLSQIDTMKKAILARAFRGELGTNDPAEESAAELLRTVL